VTPVQLLLMAKAPVPGLVKTRLCPPCTPEQAASVAAAALADTIDTLAATPASRRTLILSGRIVAPAGWDIVAQRGIGLGERLANAYADAAWPGHAQILVGMDTPQLPSALLADAGERLCRVGVDAVLGLARDGGWWALGLHDHRAASVLRTVPMSTSDTGERTLLALRARGMRVELLPILRDVDTADDAHAVAALCPGTRFADAVHAHVGVRV
jgi:uncharacterized protein